MSIVDTILGKPIASSQQEEEKINVWTGIPVLGLDGLSSAAYGPEAALTILMPLGILGLSYIGPIMMLILGLLAILYFSYRQTIAAYPGGGGSYTVAKENLGIHAGLLAAASLVVDYVLTVAVGISAGIGALVSAFPALHPHILPLCLVTLVLITLVNLRGLRESGLVFGLPTYAFVLSLGVMIVVGLVKYVTSGGHPQPVDAPPAMAAATSAASLWLLARAFASGCTAMTGVEAVSNGVSAFQKPAVPRAQQTLTAIVAILALLLAGIAFLAHAYGIGAMDPDRNDYQSVLSLLVAAIMGRGVFYYASMGSVLLVLALSANTSFADFPRLCRMIADDDYLPHLFRHVGRRLVFSGGIWVLAVLSAFILILFGGITDRLIPLYAVGAFGAFTLSQAGMVEHWRRVRGPGWGVAIAINALGAVATSVALLVILSAKFVEGAWITVLLIPGLLVVFATVHAHYARVSKEITCGRPVDVRPEKSPIVVIPVDDFTHITERALRFALTVSEDVVLVHVGLDEAHSQALEARWQSLVLEPLRNAGRPVPRYVTIPSPYRRVFLPLLEFIDHLKPGHDRLIAVIIPELVERHFYEHWLHNHRAMVLKGLLLLSGDERIIVINIPWYLK